MMSVFHCNTPVITYDPPKSQWYPTVVASAGFPVTIDGPQVEYRWLKQSDFQVKVKAVMPPLNSVDRPFTYNQHPYFEIHD